MLIGLENRVRVRPVPPVGSDSLGAVEFQIAPRVFGVALGCLSQLLEALGREPEFREVVPGPPLPHDVAGRGDLVESLIADHGGTQLGHLPWDRHQQQVIAVRQQLPVVVLPGRPARRLRAPFPHGLAGPRQLPDGAVGVDPALRLRQDGQLHADVAAAPAVERGVEDPRRHACVRPLVADRPGQVDQPGGAVGPGEEDESVVGPLRIVIGDAAELNQCHARNLPHRPPSSHPCDRPDLND